MGIGDRKWRSRVGSPPHTAGANQLSSPILKATSKQLVIQLCSPPALTRQPLRVQANLEGSPSALSPTRHRQGSRQEFTPRPALPWKRPRGSCAGHGGPLAPRAPRAPDGSLALQPAAARAGPGSPATPSGHDAMASACADRPGQSTGGYVKLPSCLALRKVQTRANRELTAKRSSAYCLRAKTVCQSELRRRTMPHSRYRSHHQN